MSKLTKPQLEPLEDRINRYMSDPDIMKLDREIATARAILDQLSTDELDINSVPYVVSLLATIGNLAKKKKEIEDSRKYTIHISVVYQIMEKIVAVTRKYVSPEQQRALSIDLENAFALPSPKHE